VIKGGRMRTVFWGNGVQDASFNPVDFAMIMLVHYALQKIVDISGGIKGVRLRDRTKITWHNLSAKVP